MFSVMIVEQFILEKLRARYVCGEAGREPCVLNDEALAVQYGVHVRTMRNVLAKLEEEGRLRVPESERLKPSLRETIALFEAREAIEGMAARLVVRRSLASGEADHLRHLAENIDKYLMNEQQLDCEVQFHKQVVALSGNDLLMRMFTMVEPILLGGLAPGVSRIHDIDSSKTLPEMLRQRHVKLVDILQEGGEEDAERAFREHCTKVISFIIAETRGVY